MSSINGLRTVNTVAACKRRCWRKLRADTVWGGVWKVCYQSLSINRFFKLRQVEGNNGVSLCWRRVLEPCWKTDLIAAFLLQRRDLRLKNTLCYVTKLRKKWSNNQTQEWHHTWKCKRWQTVSLPMHVWIHMFRVEWV